MIKDRTVRNERLKRLYQVIAGIPNSAIQLDLWRTNFYRSESNKDTLAASQVLNLTFKEASTDCGSAACVLGWACAFPEFKDQGLRITDWGSPFFPQSDGMGYVNFDAGAEFFEITRRQSERLFSDANHRPASEHKAIALRRLRGLMVELGIITRQRADELKAEEAKYD